MLTNFLPLLAVLFAIGTVSTFYSDGNPETTSVDGQLANEPAATTWATIHDAASGTSIDDSGGSISLAVSADTVANQWVAVRRGAHLFDTASIPDGDTIDSATFEFVAEVKVDTLSPAGSVRMVTTTPASNTALVVGDFSQTGGTPATAQATDLTVASLTADSATFNVFTLNATGRGNISKTGVSKFGIRIASDGTNTEPTWSSNNQTRVVVATAEEILAGDKRPKLVVTHTAPPATFTPRAMVF